MQDGERRALAHIDKSKLFEWVHPRNISGIDKETLINTNFISYARDSSKSLDKDDAKTGDDQLIAEYLEECIAQRQSMASKFNLVLEISSIKHLEALLYLLTEYQTQINFCDIDRYSMTYADYGRGLSLIETKLKLETREWIKLYLIEFTYYFFCFQYLSPELETLPQLQVFLRDANNQKRLESLNG